MSNEKGGRTSPALALAGKAMPDRSFPPPWTVEDHNDACFIVEDRSGYALAYMYYEEEPGRRSAANLMTGDEARHKTENLVTSITCREFAMRHTQVERPT